MRLDPEALKAAQRKESLERVGAESFAANARFSTVKGADGDGDDTERKTSAAAKMKVRKNSLAGLTKEERIAKRKASMTAGDSWEDLHGTKDRPEPEFGREISRRNYERKRREAAAASAGAGASSVTVRV